MLLEHFGTPFSHGKNEVARQMKHVAMTVAYYHRIIFGIMTEIFWAKDMSPLANFGNLTSTLS